MKNLTGKCKGDFGKWIITEMYYLGDDPLSDLFLNALIIEFFDSVGIYISTSALKMFYKDPMFKCKIEFITEVIECGDLYFKTRQEATNEAIIKANQLFNEL